MISVSVRLFAVARELAGAGETVLSVEDGATASSVVDYLVTVNPRFSEWKNYLRIAVNSEYVGFNHPLRDEDEIAIIPPVSGG